MAIFAFSSVDGQIKLKINIDNTVNYSYTVTGYYWDGSSLVFINTTIPASTKVELSYVGVYLVNLRISEPGQTPVANFTMGPAGGTFPQNQTVYVPWSPNWVYARYVNYAPYPNSKYYYIEIQ